MTDVELIDARNFFVQHHPGCPKEPYTCGLDKVFVTLIHRLLPFYHPLPTEPGLYDRKCGLWKPEIIAVVQ